MYAREIMTSNLVTIAPKSTVREAAQAMNKHNIGALPVYDGQKLFGMLTDRDLTVRALAKGSNSETTLVEDVMTKKCVTCADQDDVEMAINMMAKNSVRRIVVTSHDGATPIGIFSLDDIGRKGADKSTAVSAGIRLNKSGRQKPL